MYKYVLITIGAIVIISSIIVFLVGYYRNERIEGIVVKVETTEKGGSIIIFSDGRELVVKNKVPDIVVEGERYTFYVKVKKFGILPTGSYWEKIFQSENVR